MSGVGNAGPSAMLVDEAAQKRSWNLRPRACRQQKQSFGGLDFLKLTSLNIMCCLQCFVLKKESLIPIKTLNLSVLIKGICVGCGLLDQLPTYFLSLLSELELLAALKGDEPTSSVSHVVCLLFPYNALGAELLS